MTAMGFVLVMVSIMALKHPAFAYCLCEHKVITFSECTHMKERSSQQEAPHCPRCAAKQDKKDEPKNDCTLAISFDAGDFFWQDSVSEPHPPLYFDVPVVLASEYHFPSAMIIQYGCIAQQNAPPPTHLSPEFTGVYRL